MNYDNCNGICQGMVQYQAVQSAQLWDGFIFLGIVVAVLLGFFCILAGIVQHVESERRNPTQPYSLQLKRFNHWVEERRLGKRIV